MPRIDSQKFYNSAITMHGTSAQGVNWISSQTQEIRFKILLSLLPQNINSLGDAGCGFADLYTYMRKINRLPKKYIGIDSLQTMCTISSKLTQEKTLLLDITKDCVPDAEYYVCSGSMNILHSYETHLFIRNCFNASKYGFVFNILHGDKQSHTYNYISKDTLLKIAKSLKVNRVEIRDNYMKNDITVGFFHV